MSLDAKEKRTDEQNEAPLQKQCSLKCGFQNFGFEAENQDRPNDKKLKINFNVRVKEEEKGESTNKPSTWIQTLSALCNSLPSFFIGASVAITGVILPQLTSPDDVSMNQTESALFASLILFGAMIGSAANGILTAWLGQRKALLMVIPIAVATSILMYLSHSILILLILRTVTGIICGTLGASTVTYVVEMSYKSSRGFLSSLIHMSRQIGVMVVQLVGSTNLNWRETTIICCVPPLIFSFMGLLFLPNSPRWLATKQKFDEAYEALRFFRGNDYNCEEEFCDIRNEALSYNKKNSFQNQLKYLMKWPVLKRFLLITLLMMALMLSGNTSILSYTIIIFKEVQVDINEYVSVVIVGTAGIFGNLLYSLVADKYERKTMFNIFMIISSLCLFLLGGFYFAKKYVYITRALSWIPLFSIVIFRISYCICYPALSLLCNELLPTRVRILGLGIVNCLSFLSGSLAVLLFPYLTKIIEFHGVFWLYATICILILIISVKWLPETKDCSLEDIETKFSEIEV